MSSDKEKKISIASGWGKRLKAKRESLGLNQTDLAKLATVGGSSGYISELENEKKIPGGDVLYSLSRALGVSMDWIFSGDQPTDGLSREVRDAIQKAVLMVEDFISVVPAEKQDGDRGKKALFIVTVTSLLIAGRQDEIPALMAELMRSYSGQPKPP